MRFLIKKINFLHILNVMLYRDSNSFRQTEAGDKDSTINYIKNTF